MLPEISKIKGIHPGIILSRELKKRALEKKLFALSLGEYPQTISAISNGHRGVTPGLSIKLGNALGIDENYFMLLQAYYEIKKEKEKLSDILPKPDLSKIRKIVFWDTDISLIHWEKQRKAVIRRIFERGNEVEIIEIISFYGKDVIIKELKTLQTYLPILLENAKKYLNFELQNQ